MNSRNKLFGALAPIFLAPILAACSGQLPGNQSPPVARAAALGAQWQDGRLAIDVPVRVITLGVPDERVQQLQAELTPYLVDQQTGNDNQILSPDPAEIQDDGAVALVPLSGEVRPNPVLPTAIYQLMAAPAALAAEFRAELDAIKLDGELFDGNALEEWLAAALARHGMALNAGAPSMVLLDLRGFGIGNHGWKITGPAGYLAPVRIFGERQALLVLDPSAIADFFDPDQVYSEPAAAGSLTAIAQMVRDATDYRLLQASVYPIAQAPCHAVTGILGVKSSSLAERGVLSPVEENFHPDWIKSSWDHLTGTDVFFDLKVLSLPVDDPVLDAISRGESPGLYLLELWVTLNWDKYHVDHPGCEDYLAVVFANDAAGVPGSLLLSGYGSYDDNPGKRIAMGWTHDVFRLLSDPDSPVCAFPERCEGRDYLNFADFLFSHEAGHLFGQSHPHDIERSDGFFTNLSFSAIWSSMSYKQEGRVIDFGAVDRNNWQRNRAGFALELAAQNGREGSAAWNAALDAAQVYDWQGVWAALRE